MHTTDTPLSPKILAISGSSRLGSYNQALLEVAAARLREKGAEVTLIQPKEFVLPLYEEELEKNQGLPEAAVRLKSLFTQHQGLLFASPEYNSSMTPLLKNLIDWVSRPAPGEAPLVAFRGKVAALMSASPGGLGGLRGLTHLREVLGNIGVIVMPDQLALGQAHEAIADGRLKVEKDQKMFELMLQNFLDICRRRG